MFRDRRKLRDEYISTSNFEIFSVKRDNSSGLLPRVCFNLLTGLPPCVAVCIGPKCAIETTSILLVGEDWFSTLQHKVAKF